MTSKSTKFARKRTLPSKPQWTPHSYQLEAAKFLVANGAAGLLLDPGLGKTSITLAAFSSLKESGVARGLLVIAPLRPAQDVWPEEIEGWADFAGLKYCVLHGKDKDELAHKRHDVFIINYEGLQWLIDSGHLKRMLRDKWIDVLVFDELSKMKHSNSKRFKLMRPWLPQFARRWGLTGSPASNGLMDLFGQAYVLDLGRSLGPFVTHFRAQYCVPDGPYGWRLRAGADTEIYERVRPLMLRMSAEDYIKMPDLVVQIHRIPLPPKVRALYDEMELELVAGIRAGTITAANEGVKAMKLRQICAGAIYYDSEDPLTQVKTRVGYEALHTGKTDALVELVDELQGEQLLVAYEFQHTMEQIRKALPDAQTVSGTNEKELAKLKNAWNSGKLPYLCGHPMSIGHGLNLQKSSAHHVAFLTVPQDYELYDQFIRRLRRQGNKAAKVIVHLFVAANTIESMRATFRLKSKETTQQAFFKAMCEELL